MTAGFLEVLEPGLHVPFIQSPFRISTQQHKTFLIGRCRTTLSQEIGKTVAYVFQTLPVRVDIGSRAYTQSP